MQIDSFGEILKKQGVHSGSGVPCSFFTPLVNYMAQDSGMDYLPAASEGEAVAIAAGYVAAGKRAFALMQNSGLGNAVNPITSLLHIYRIPVSLLISHRGEPGRKDEPQHALMGEITESLSKLCGLETHVMNPETMPAELEAQTASGAPTAWIFRKGVLEGGPKPRPIELKVDSGAAPHVPHQHLEPEMSRERALRATLPFLNRDGARRPAVVSTTGKLSRELFELDDRDHARSNRFMMVGSMGCAAAFGLGIARASDRRVVVLDGDGAVLMKMGTLGTIGMAQPKRFHHIVFDNGAYDTTGGQLTASPNVDFAQIALSCGYRRADTVASESEYQERLNEHLDSDGPTLLRVVIQAGCRSDLGRPTITPEDQWKRFTAFLGGA